MTTENITDQATATAALNLARERLARAKAQSAAATAELHGEVVRVRPLGLATVGQMADAIGRDRNYVDSVWSGHGGTVKGKQTRASADVTDDQRRATLERLSDVASYQRRMTGLVKVARADRDRVVAMVYASKIMGPSAIAAAVGIDRNHVLRIARRADLDPAWRPVGASKNQYTAKSGS